jgi:hypothetical protein
MNGILAVGTSSDYARSGGGGAMFVAAFALVGLILLVAALHLILKRRDSANHRYTLRRH